MNMKNRSNHPFQVVSRSALRRGGFTLVEILVAVAIMSLLLSIIFVPLRLGFETTHIGKVNSELQQEAHLAIQQIANDLRKAQFVFPNSRISKVTDNINPASPCSVAPYKSGDTTNPNDWNYRPYIIADVNFAPTQDFGVCSPVSPAPPVTTNKSVRAWNNPGRLDMLQLRRDKNGATANSKAGQDYIVSYYFRRLDALKSYDAIDNPIALFRAQIPYQNRVNDNPSIKFSLPNNRQGEKLLNAETDWTEYPQTIGDPATCTTPAVIGEKNRSFAWITHNFYGEANLEPLTTKDAKNPQNASGNQIPNAQTVPGAHTLVTPAAMGLFAPRADTLDSGGNRVAEAFVPELSFSEEATEGGRINRVTISMTLAKYDEAGATAVNGQGKALKVRVSQTVDLPNAGCSN